MSSSSNNKESRLSYIKSIPRQRYVESHGQGCYCTNCQKSTYQHSSSSSTRQGSIDHISIINNQDSVPSSSKIPAPTSHITEPISSMTRLETATVTNTASGMETNAQEMRAMRPGELSETGPPNSAIIRMASASSGGSGSNVQTTKVKVIGAGLKPTRSEKKCQANCPAAANQELVLKPCTEEIERGNAVPPGMYYMPITAGGACQKADDKMPKLRQKLQKYRPPCPSHWKSDRGTYEPDYQNTQLEKRLYPSLPEQQRSLCLREAMMIQSGIYEQNNPDGQKDAIQVENTIIERQYGAQFPGDNLECGSPPIAEATGSQPRSVQTPLLDATDAASNSRSIDHPQYKYTVKTSEVKAPRMKSPVGEIDAQHSIYANRVVQSSPRGTTVDTAVRGNKLVSPGQAMQIDIVKQDRMPPPSEYCTSPTSQIPQLQYIMPPRTPNQPINFSMQGNVGSPEYSLLAERGSPVQQSPSPSRRHSKSMSPTAHSLVTYPDNYNPATYESPSSPRQMSPLDIPYSPKRRTYTPNGSPDRGQRGPCSPQCQRSPNSPQRSMYPTQGPPPRIGCGRSISSPLNLSKGRKPPPPVSPVRLDPAVPVPKTPQDASLDVIRRLVDEERQDVAASLELPPPLAKKLNKLKKKPQSTRILEETLDQSVPVDEDSETLKSDLLAELMYSQETDVIITASSPKKTYDMLFPPLSDEQAIYVSPAAGKNDTPERNSFAEVVTEYQLPQLEPTEKKSREIQESEHDKADYIPRGALDDQKAPWDIDLGSLEDLVNGKMSMMSAWDNLPSDESAGRLEYVLDVQKPLHHSCVQLRGSQLPAWFPGFYNVLPHVDGFIRLEKSPSQAFAAAWKIFAPYQTAEQSEIVYL